MKNGPNRRVNFPLKAMKPGRGSGGWTAFVAGLVASLVFLATPARGQLGTVKDFKYPEFYEQKSAAGKRALKLLVLGAQARPQLSGLLLLTEMRIESYSEEGKTNLIIRSPECLLNAKARVASSSGPLEMQSGDGNLSIQGQGFLCYLTNFSLFISNQVQTVVRREMVKSAASPTPPVNRLSAVALAPDLTNQTMRIYADRFNFDYGSNLITYSSQVRVEDPQMDLACETLTLTRTTNGALGRIVADQNVKILGKADQSRAFGDRAVYLAEDDLVVLSGQDARWQDREREGRAGTFTFDRKQNTLRAERRAWMKLPGGAGGSSDWLLGDRGSPPAATTAKTNEFIEISAELFDVQLPTTNRPSRTVIAQTNVVILSSREQSRATGDRAAYDEANGTVELIGNAVWESGQRLVKGNTLFFDRTNRIFRARQNAYLKFPVRDFGPQPPSAAGALAAKGAQPPQFIEIISDNFDYQTDLLTFRENVRGKFLEGETLRARFTSRSLEVKFSKQLERIVARQDVVIEQIPFVAATGRMISKSLRCERFTVAFRTNGLVESFLAEEKVVAQQIETRPAPAEPVETRMTAGVVDAQFAAQANEVRTVVARQHVVITQGDRSAQGDQMVYTTADEWVVLTGNPTAQVPQARITKAEALVWDRRHNRLSTRGKTIAEGSNQSGLRFSK